MGLRMMLGSHIQTDHQVLEYAGNSLISSCPSSLENFVQRCRKAERIKSFTFLNRISLCLVLSAYSVLIMQVNMVNIYRSVR